MFNKINFTLYIYIIYNLNFLLYFNYILHKNVHINNIQ